VQDARHLGLRRLAQRLAGLAFDQRLQAAHSVVVEFFVHGGLGRGAAGLLWVGIRTCSGSKGNACPSPPRIGAAPRLVNR